MATNTTNYGFKKPDESDFYDVADQNKNWDLADEALKNLDTPTFEDYTGSTAVPSATDAIDQIKSKGKLGTLLSNIKAAFKGACLIGHIVNNCVTDNTGLPLSAAQGKVLKDLIDTTNNNLSNKADKTSLSSYALKSDLFANNYQTNPDLVTTPFAAINGFNNAVTNIPDDAKNTWNSLQTIWLFPNDIGDLTKNRLQVIITGNNTSHRRMYENGKFSDWS